MTACLQRLSDLPSVKSQVEAPGTFRGCLASQAHHVINAGRGGSPVRDNATPHRYRCCRRTAATAEGCAGRARYATDSQSPLRSAAKVPAQPAAQPFFTFHRSRPGSSGTTP